MTGKATRPKEKRRNGIGLHRARVQIAQGVNRSGLFVFSMAFFLVLGGLNGAAHSEELQWRPANAAASSASPALPVATVPVATTPGWKVQMGAPIPLSSASSPQLDRQSVSGSVAKNEPSDSFNVTATAFLYRGQAPGAVPNVPPPPLPGGAPGKALGEEDFNCGNVLAPGTSKAPSQGFFSNLCSCFNRTGGAKPFESDHCFDSFISPVTNPMLFEDPRALTEFRPIFIYQQIPHGNATTNGGNIENLNFQGSVALTDWLSITFNEIGWTWINPSNSSGVHSGSGFSEVQVGPKFTFLRNEKGSGFFGQSIMAAGLVFEIPIGSGSVYQDTGFLSLRPYITYGQQFLASQTGSFHFLTTAGYSFAVDSERSDHLFLSAHLDYELFKKLYPFVEMNYFLYTNNGHSQPIAFEGADLINFGAEHVSGHSDLSLALGARYKFTEHIQVGGAFEYGLVGQHDLEQFRFTVDMIFRY